MDLIIQNNGDKRMWLISGLTNVSNSHIYVEFDDVDLPQDVSDGEYSYALLHKPFSGSVYTFKTDLWDTIVSVNGIDFKLSDLKPVTGVLRVGKVEDKNIYQDKDNKTYYYQK